MVGQVEKGWVRDGEDILGSRHTWKTEEKKGPVSVCLAVSDARGELEYSVDFKQVEVSRLGGYPTAK